MTAMNATAMAAALAALVLAFLPAATQRAATGANRLIFSAPTLTRQPAGCSGSPTLEIKVGSGSVSSAEQEQPVACPGTTLAVNARASDDVPFPAGDDRVTTVVSRVPVTDGAPTS